MMERACEAREPADGLADGRPRWESPLALRLECREGVGRVRGVGAGSLWLWPLALRARNGARESRRERVLSAQREAGHAVWRARETADDPRPARAAAI